MDSPDLLVGDGDGGGIDQQWQPLQPTSTPKVLQMGTQFDDPLVGHYMNHEFMSSQFDPYVSTTGQGHGPGSGPAQPPPSGAHAMSNEQWMLMRQAERDKQQHELLLMEMNFKSEQMRLQAEKEQREFELERLRLQNELSQQQSLLRDTPHFKDIRVNALVDSDDIDVYLSAFERLAEANKWPTTQWATRLAAALTGKAREAFTRLSMNDAGDYGKLKDAVLRAYNLTPEAYRLKFRSGKRQKDETHMQFAVRLQSLFDRWISGDKVTNLSELQDLLIREQMLDSYYFQLQV